jgi:hypothetical protein
MESNLTKTHLFTFLSAALSHWITLMSGGLITVALGIFERVTGRNIPLWVYVGIITGFAFSGCYLAWRDERIKKNAIIQQLEHEIAELKDRKEEKARRRFLRERLGEFLDEGEKIRWGLLTRDVESHKGHGLWLRQVQQFLSLEPEFDSSHVARFKAEQIGALRDFIRELTDSK